MKHIRQILSQIALICLLLQGTASFGRGGGGGGHGGHAGGGHGGYHGNGHGGGHGGYRRRGYGYGGYGYGGYGLGEGLLIGTTIAGSAAAANSAAEDREDAEEAADYVAEQNYRNRNRVMIDKDGNPIPPRNSGIVPSRYRTNRYRDE